MRVWASSADFRPVMMDWLCSNMGSKGECSCKYFSARCSLSSCSFRKPHSHLLPPSSRAKDALSIPACAWFCCCCCCCCFKVESQLRASAVAFHSLIRSSFCLNSSDCSCACFPSHIFFCCSRVRRSSEYFFSQSRFARAVVFCSLASLTPAFCVAMASLIAVTSSSARMWMPSSFRFWFSYSVRLSLVAAYISAPISE